MGTKRTVPRAETDASEEAEDMSQQEGEVDSGFGSDGGNDYGMGDDEEGSSGDEEEGGEAMAGRDAPGILGLTGGSDGEGDDEGEDDDGDDGDDDDGGDGDDDDDGGRDPGSSDADDEGSSGGGSDADGEGDGGAGPRVQHASFLSGEKGASFAKAFSKIISKPVKGAAREKKEQQQKQQQQQQQQPGSLILAESAGVQKRKHEEEEDAAARHEAKKQRLAMKARGHLAVPRKGEDPAHDTREKQLQRLATRGVVLLFNAVNKAQKQKAEADAAGGISQRKAAAAKLSKASFLAELKQAATTGVPVTAAADGARLAAGGQQQQQQQASASRGGGGAGWDVLGEGFPGLTRGAKMKDWDKKAGSDSDDEVGEQPRLATAEISSDEGDGW